jgi:hypothetical protein
MDTGKITRTIDVFARAHALLVDAEALIARPHAWTRRALARDARRREVLASEPDACQWCLIGALTRVYHRAVVTAVRDSDSDSASASITAWRLGRRAALRALAREAGAEAFPLPDLDEQATDILMVYNDRAPSKRAVLTLLRRAQARLERGIMQQARRLYA